MAQPVIVADQLSEKQSEYMHLIAEIMEIRKRGEKDIWKGLWEPLVIEGTEVCSAPTLLRSGVKHQLTHRTLIVDFYMWEPSERPQLPEGYIWIQEAELDRYAKPRLFELLLDGV